MGGFSLIGAVHTAVSKLFNRVDGDGLFGSKIIDTIDTFEADEPAPIAPAERYNDATVP